MLPLLGIWKESAGQGCLKLGWLLWGSIIFSLLDLSTSVDSKQSLWVAKWDTIVEKRILELGGNKDWNRA